MRLRNVKNAREIVDNSSFVVHNPEEYKGKYNKEVFNNENPIHLEIGMGKGNFIIDKAIKNPNINFIGVERYESVLCRALEKLEDKKLPNVIKAIFLSTDLLTLSGIFASSEPFNTADCCYVEDSLIYVSSLLLKGSMSVNLMESFFKE
jgi:tRNA (guanine-N7-)-methyltransferase